MSNLESGQKFESGARITKIPKLVNLALLGSTGRAGSGANSSGAVSSDRRN